MPNDISDPVSESTFWWVVSGGSALAIAIAGGLVAWVKGLVVDATKEASEKSETLDKNLTQAISDSKRDRENLWDELRERTDQYNREMASIIDRINAVKDSYVRRDDMAEKFQILSNKFDEQAALIELIRNRIHDLAQVVTANRNLIHHVENKK